MTPALTTLLGLLLWAAGGPPVVAEERQSPDEPQALDAQGRWPEPTELFEVLRVVDGDTVHIRRDGEYEKLRLLSVDTEEKLSFEGSASKPGTVFGEETSLWAQELFAELGDEPRIGLRFPNGVEARDVYDRLLCHVVMPDGTDFNLLLVELGKSPYFNKYGNSRLCHDAFVAAQDRARHKRLGVWNPRTNEPATAGAPAAKRPYDKLLPWWDACAVAIESFRVADRADDEAVGAADDPEDLEQSLAAKRESVRVFGQIFRVFEEDDGSLTLLFRGDRDRSFRALVPASVRAELTLDLDAVQREFHQNFLWVDGQLARGARGGWQIVLGPNALSLAGPDPTVAAHEAAAETPEPVEVGGH